MSNLERREFLTQAAGALAAMAIMPDVLPAAPVARGAALPVAIIGVGRQGGAILGELSKLEAVSVAAVCDTEQSRVDRGLRRVSGAEGFTDYRALLDKKKDVQAIIIATPTHQHKDLALAAMKAGKHVYLEAPIAHTIDDARAIAQAAAALPAKQIFQAGMQFRENPQHHHVLKFIRTGATGKPSMSRGQWNKKTSWRKASPNPDREKALNWRLYKETSLGLVGEIGIHSLDTAGWYLGSTPVSVTGFGGITQWQDDREVADTVQVIMEFANGVRHSWSATLANSFEGEHDVYFGASAAVLIRDNRAWMFKESDAELLGWEVYARKEDFLTDSGIALVANATKILAQGKKPAEAASETDSPVRYALEKFVEHVNDGTAPEANAEVGYRAVVMAVKAQEAVLKGGRVEIPKDLLKV